MDLAVPNEFLIGTKGRLLEKTSRFYYGWYFSGNKVTNNLSGKPGKEKTIFSTYRCNYRMPLEYTG